MKFIMAIDQGTTGTRTIIYDKHGHIITSAYAELKQYFPRPGWVEHNPEEIWTSVFTTIQKVLRKLSPQSIAAIGITNQRETAILWDTTTGKPIYNAIVWQCRRTTQRCNNLKINRSLSTLIRSRTGLPIDAYFSASKIEWIFDHVPHARLESQKGNIAFGTSDSWILWKLTGGKIHSTDYTNASRTMLFNIDKLSWDSQLLKIFNIPQKILPSVKPSASYFGTTVSHGKLPPGIPITGIAGDQQAALFGQVCFDPGTIKNTYGTGSFLLMNTGKKRPESKHGLITTIGCGRKGEPIYVLEGSIFITGAAIQWLRDEMKLLKRASDSNAIAQSVTDNAGVYFVPAFVGLGAPHWNSEVRGLITGLTRGTTSSHIIRAALEAMCFQTRDVIDAMQKDSHLKINKFKIDGGVVANDFVCQFQADILGIDVIRPAISEITSLGAAYLAGLTINYWKDWQAIQRCWKIDKIFHPRMKKSYADQQYDQWVHAVKQTLII